MRRKLYFLLPSIQSAQHLLKELLQSGLNARQIHFVANRNKPLDNLPVANIVQSSGLMMTAGLGLAFGLAFGLLGGLMAVMFPNWFGEVSPRVIPYYMVIGGVFCAIWGGIIAIGITNRRIGKFKKQIEQGKVLMMVAVPNDKLTEIKKKITKNHPEAVLDGEWSDNEQTVSP